MRLLLAAVLALTAAHPALARTRETTHKLRGSAEIKAVGVLERTFRVDVDMTVKRRDASAVELVFSFKGHGCSVFGKVAGSRVELDAEQACKIAFAEKGYEVALLAKLSEPHLDLAAGKATISTRFVAEGTVAYNVTVLGFTERVSMPVAGDGRVQLDELARPS
jgi:hypothetical protein